jgi:hypothetical protein
VLRIELECGVNVISINTELCESSDAALTLPPSNFVLNPPRNLFGGTKNFSLNKHLARTLSFGLVFEFNTEHSDEGER